LASSGESDSLIDKQTAKKSSEETRGHRQRHHAPLGFAQGQRRAKCLLFTIAIFEGFAWPDNGISQAAPGNARN